MKLLTVTPLVPEARWRIYRERWWHMMGRSARVAALEIRQYCPPPRKLQLDCFVFFVFLVFPRLSCFSCFLGFVLLVLSRVFVCLFSYFLGFMFLAFPRSSARPPLGWSCFLALGSAACLFAFLAGQRVGGLAPPLYPPTPPRPLI